MQHVHMQITQKFQSNNSYNYVQMTTVTVTDINLNKFAVVYFGNQCECTSDSVHIIILCMYYIFVVCILYNYDRNVLHVCIGSGYTGCQLFSVHRDTKILKDWPSKLRVDW